MQKKHTITISAEKYIKQGTNMKAELMKMYYVIMHVENRVCATPN